MACFVFDERHAVFARPRCVPLRLTDWLDHQFLDRLRVNLADPVGASAQGGIADSGGRYRPDDSRAGHSKQVGTTRREGGSKG